MDPKGAAYTSKMMKLEKVFPIHWGTFIPPLVGTPQELTAELAGSGIGVEEWNPGDSVTL